MTSGTPSNQMYAVLQAGDQILLPEDVHILAKPYLQRRNTTQQAYLLMLAAIDVPELSYPDAP